METKMQVYLDKAVKVLEKFEIVPKEGEESKLAELLQDVVAVDEPKVLAITKTLRHISAFNALVRENVSDMNFSDRYNQITKLFDSIRDDYQKLLKQIDDGKIDLKEKVQNWWMWLARGTPHQRFEKIMKIYQDVTADTKGQLDNEMAIIDAYTDFRFALKEAEVIANELIDVQEKKMWAAHAVFKSAIEDLGGWKNLKANDAEKARLQLARDEAQRAFNGEGKKYQLIKDIAENLSVGYNVGETLVAKLNQTHEVKEQVYKKSIVFFTTNEHVFTTLDAVYSSQHGLHEATQTIESMKAGVNKGLEQIADLGRDLEKAALKAGYGSTISPQSVQKLVDAVVAFQLDSLQLIDQHRKEATESAKLIEKSVEEGKQKCTDAINKYYSEKKL